MSIIYSKLIDELMFREGFDIRRNTGYEALSDDELIHLISEIDKAR